ncbi:IS5 family transposase [Streptomyces sp. NPDC055109]
MSADLVPDDLWERVAPLLPVRPARRHRYPGRLPADDRAALRGIVYVLGKSVSWRNVPRSVWPQLHEVLLTEPRAAGRGPAGHGRRRDRRLARPVAEGGGSHRTFAGRPGPARQQDIDRHGIPLAVLLTRGKRHDVTQLIPLLDAIPPIRGLRGRPRRRPRQLFADRGYDYDTYRRLIPARGITPKSARKGITHGSGLGKTRWVVERSFAWLRQFKRLRIRYEIRADLHLALLQLARSVICLRRLRTSF